MKSLMTDMDQVMSRFSHTSTSPPRASPPRHAHSQNMGHEDNELNSDFIMDLPPPPPAEFRMVPPPPPRGVAAPPQPHAHTHTRSTGLSSLGLSSFSSSSPDDMSKNLCPGGAGYSSGYRRPQHASASLPHHSLNHSSASLHRDLSPPANALSYERGSSSTSGGGGGGAPSAYGSFVRSKSPPVSPTTTSSNTTSAYNDFRVHL